MGRGRTLVAAMWCGAFVVALCGSAHAGVAASSDPTTNVTRVAQSLPDELTPRIPDPTNDPVSSVQDKVGAVVDKTTDTVAGSTSGVTRPDPERIVKKVVATVKDVVDKVLPPPQTVSDPATRQQQEEARHNAADHRHSAAARHRHLHHRPARGPGFHVSAPLTIAGAARATQSSHDVKDDSSSGGILQRIGRAAKEIAFPALLALLVIAFLIAQDRIDKSDPKLITWTPEQDGELVAFE